MQDFKFTQYEGSDTCPPWWPEILWELHARMPWNTPGPPNYPPVMNEILSALVIHTTSYFIEDVESATAMRQAAEKTIIDCTHNMHRLHTEAVHK
jgi:hypothetical protein